MKKRGFTLVELLAVIAILAILVIIALPNVLGMFNSAKKNTFVTEIESIYKQAQTDFINDSLQSSGERYYCSDEDATQTVHDGSSKQKCKNLNITTTKTYYIEMDSSGVVQYIGVQDNSFVYGNGVTNSINDIIADQVLDASENTSFDVNSKNTTTAP